MPAIASMRRTFRKFLLVTLILTVLLHEPTFKFTLNALINAHVFCRLVFNASRDFTIEHFPAFANWILDVFNVLHDYVALRYAEFVRAIEPMLQWVAGHVLRRTMAWLEKSPAYLCEVNEWIAGVGENVVQKSVGKNATIIEQWHGTTADVQSFCAALSGTFDELKEWERYLG